MSSLESAFYAPAFLPYVIQQRFIRSECGQFFSRVTDSLCAPYARRFRQKQDISRHAPGEQQPRLVGNPVKAAALLVSFGGMVAEPVRTAFTRKNEKEIVFEPERMVGRWLDAVKSLLESRERFENRIDGQAFML